MSGLGTCRDCNAWIYWADCEADDGTTRHVPFDEAGHVTMHWQTCAAADYITLGSTAYKVEKCSKCRHRVYWETTRHGKKRPMDTYQDDLTNEWLADGDCHFDTCVGARSSAHTNNWRAQDARRAPPRPTAQPVNEAQRLVRLWVRTSA